MPLLTIVFTDVVESSATKRDVSLGRDSHERDLAYLKNVQTRHFEMVRACCNCHGGQEVSTMGDAFYLTFEEPVQAIRCAVDIQRQLAANPIQTPAEGEAQRSLRLAGAAAALRQQIGAPLPPPQRAELEELLAPARKTLSDVSASAA